MITVRYTDYSIKEYETFEDIINNDLVIILDCSNNKLTHLPENMNFTNLRELNCNNNNLTYLPITMNFPKLKELYCRHNNLSYLPKTTHLSNLEILICNHNQITHLPDTMDLPNLKELYCQNNNLTYLPDNMNLPNLEKLNLDNNNLIHLPENMIFPNLQVLYCRNNNLRQLPNNMNLLKLQHLNCSNNKLIYLPLTINLPNLEILYCYGNQLKYLPKNMYFPNLYYLDCSRNKLRHLPKIINFPNLNFLDCCFNNLTQLPLCILNFHHLEYINYDNNPIELSPQIARFVQRIQNGFINKLNVYSDTQNIHNTTIQLSVKDSINNITSRLDLPKYNLETLISLILDDPYLDCKDQLIEYCNDDSVHSLLLLTFSEVVWFTLQTIHKDFKIETQQEIKKILNQEMKAAECKCFTGRMTRVVNCLNGISPLVSIQIQDSEQIGNIIFIIKEQLDASRTYTIETHKELVSKEMTERGYTKENIDIWIEYIE